MSIVVSLVYVFSWDMIVDIQCYFYIDCDAGSMLDKGGDPSSYSSSNLHVGEYYNYNYYTSLTSHWLKLNHMT
jgi:hypothetical protein